MIEVNGADARWVAEIRTRLEPLLPDGAVLGLGEAGRFVIHLLGDGSAEALAKSFERAAENARMRNRVRSLTRADEFECIDGVPYVSLDRLIAALGVTP